jgi:hypothetical protein
VRALIAASLGALLAGSALAQDKPPTIPTRDVDVTYRMVSGDKVLHQRMRWRTDDKLLRVDPPTPGLYMVVNYGLHKLAVVRPEQHEILEADAVGMSLPGANANAQFTRRGGAQIDGLACTEWDTTDAAGQPTTVCLTADGVLLQASLGGHVVMEAEQVAYTPQDQSLFQLPQDYRVQSLPRG